MNALLHDIELSDEEIDFARTMADKNHSKTQFRLCAALAKYEDQRVISVFPEADFNLDSWLVRPDIALMPPMENDWDQEAAYLLTPPITAIEVVSAKQPVSDLFAKAREYFAHGVHSCWIVVPPTRTITVVATQAKPVSYAHGTLTDPATGIALQLEEIFR
ncbi:MAG: Uma2 family endonuclease [Candidatus Kapabacteria bacterium]|jgi:Uma2 family endonuclease|nr:Uma2 family endonuclease [Candidatus Kapabacteria bacterium]